MKTSAIIEARMGSSRLPGKVMRQAVGKPMLELLIERVQFSKRLDDLVVATTTNPLDDEIETLANHLDVTCFRGSEVDVLGRVLGAAHATSTDLIVEITADCPLLDPRAIDDVVTETKARKCDFAANRITPRCTYPDGLGLRAFPTVTLERVDRLTKAPRDREHVSIYIWEHPELFSIYNGFDSGLPEEFWNFRLTLDTLADFELIRDIFEELYPQNRNFSPLDIWNALLEKPHLMAAARKLLPA